MQSSLQDVALGDKETIPALAQDAKLCKVGSAFRGSCPIARVLYESGHICNPF